MKKTKVISVVMTNQYGEFNADYTLKFKKTKKGETEAILTAPYLEWSSSESCEIAFNVLTIKGRELECIEKYFFDRNIFTMDIQGYPGTLDMCDIVYKVMPQELYNQMISGTFKMKKDADPERYAYYFQLEKKNKAAIREFIGEQKKLGNKINQKTILYAKKIDTPSSSGDNISIILVNKLSKKDKYKVKIYFMNYESEKKYNLKENEFDDIYVAKKYFDYFEYKHKDVLTNEKRFKLFIADFNKNQIKKKDDFIMSMPDTDSTENISDEDIIPKIKEIMEENLPIKTTDLNDIFT
jgi:hypothetical protein